jgi:GAF domain-containing protein
VKLDMPALLTGAHFDELADYLDGYPQAYISEMSEHLHGEFGVVATTCTLYRALRKLRWSGKVATKRAMEQSEALRQAFIARTQHLYRSKQTVAVNESVHDERTGDCKYGWSPIGKSSWAALQHEAI